MPVSEEYHPAQVRNCTVSNITTNIALHINAHTPPRTSNTPCTTTSTNLRACDHTTRHAEYGQQAKRCVTFSRTSEPQTLHVRVGKCVHNLLHGLGAQVPIAYKQPTRAHRQRLVAWHIVSHVASVMQQRQHPTAGVTTHHTHTHACPGNEMNHQTTNTTRTTDINMLQQCNMG